MNRDIKKALKNINNEQKQFINAMYNYALTLVLNNEVESINELCDVIKYQNERREKKK